MTVRLALSWVRSCSFSAWSCTVAGFVFWFISGSVVCFDAVERNSCLYSALHLVWGRQCVVFWTGFGVVNDILTMLYHIYSGFWAAVAMSSVWWFIIARFGLHRFFDLYLPLVLLRCCFMYSSVLQLFFVLQFLFYRSCPLSFLLPPSCLAQGAVRLSLLNALWYRLLLFSMSSFFGLVLFAARRGRVSVVVAILVLDGIV